MFPLVTKIPVLLLGELRPASSAFALGPMGICVAHILLEPDLPTRLHRSSERSRGHRLRWIARLTAFG